VTNEELIKFGTRRHGPLWVAPLAAETGYSFSGLWRVSNRHGPIPARLEREIARLAKRHGAGETKKAKS
jgi:hypothetical protein